jgi:hypothetical protein
VTKIARVSPSGLKPLSPNLSPEVLTWASELRALFAATGLSINRFVLLYPHIDKGTISRYLNGKRVPRDRWFLDTLMAIQDTAGKPLTPAACEHLTELQLRALETTHPHEYKVRKVTDELETAVTSRREAERYARSIEAQLVERIRQVQELTVEKRRLRAVWSQDRADMQAELNRLNLEIVELTEQVHLARKRGMRAENRCLQLEELLHHLDPHAPVEEDEPSDDEIEKYLHERAKGYLELAQKTADQAIGDARREADETIHHARREAEELLMKARKQATKILGLTKVGGAGATLDTEAGSEPNADTATTAMPYAGDMAGRGRFPA